MKALGERRTVREDRQEYMNTMWLKQAALILLLLQAVQPLGAEEKTVAKSLVLLQFAPGKTGLSSDRFAEVLSGMGSKIALWGGYDIIVSGLAFDSEAVPALLEKLKEKTGGAAVPESVRIGETTVSRADFEVLARADVLVIPSLAEYASEEEKRTAGGSRWKVRLKTVFDFIIREGEYTRMTRMVETMGYDPNPERAQSDAVKTVLPQFTYESEMLVGREKRITVLAVDGGDVFIGAGNKRGLLPGTEFTVREHVSGEGEDTGTREKGLLLISEVTDDVSVATILYADPALELGDTVEEISRLGLEISPSALAFIPLADPAALTVYAGVRVTLAKAVYTLRPLFAIESVVYPFSTYQLWFPLRPFVGAEIRLHFGRFELAALPMIGIEHWFSLAPEQSSRFIGFGLRGLVQASLLVSRDVKVFLEGGYEYWFGTREGLLAGGGISIKL
jgi:hypothetical protein